MLEIENNNGQKKQNHSDVFL